MKERLDEIRKRFDEFGLAAINEQDVDGLWLLAKEGLDGTACKSAYRELIGGEPYSWQRGWQVLARLWLDMPDDSTIEDLRLAMALRTKAGTP